MPRLATTRPLQLDDLCDLCERYVPIESRHPKARTLPDADSWWPAHELGHLLTVPRARIGQPLFGIKS